jgi:phosphate binding protein
MKVRATLLLMLLALSMMVSVSIVMAQDDATIADIVLTSSEGDEPEFSVLLAAVLAADASVLELLSNPDSEVTVFAPTDAAFAELPGVVIEYLLTDTELLTAVLAHHVVEGVVTSDMVSTMMAPTLAGEELNIVVSDMGVRINQANVVVMDIEAANGVIHVIDSVLLPTVELPLVDPLSALGNIEIDGSSTVYPVTERMADLFNRDGFPDRITVDFSGTGAGFQRFCQTGDTDISDASRPIRPAEEENCLAIGREPVEFYVGIDALAVTVSRDNTFIDNLTMEELETVFSGVNENGDRLRWSDVNSEWPAEFVQLYAPGTDSGTYDFFVEEVFDRNEELILNAPGIQLSEDDNVLVQGVIGSQFAIGFYGYAYYQENDDVTRAIAINGVEPNEETGASGEYPLARPLFIYSTPSIMQEKPQVAEFINYYLRNVPAELGSSADQIGYIATNEYIRNLNRLTLIAAMGVER